MSIDLKKLHLSKKVPLYLTIQAILESREKYSLEEVVGVEEELKMYLQQLCEMRNQIYEVAHEKWTQTMLNKLK